MSRRPRIGYYVHHHGHGHASRAAAIAGAFPGEVTFLGSLPPARLREAGPVVSLPLEDDGVAAAPPDLHFAPLHSPGLRERMAIIARWIAAEAPDLLVVDVSVEVAALARLCGVPVVYIRQSGRRDDPAHRLAYSWAAGLLSPYPDWLEPEGTPAWVLDRSFHSGAITRFDGGGRPPLYPRAKRLLAIGDRPARRASEVARAAPDWRVVAAAHGPLEGPPNLVAVDPQAVDLELLASAAAVLGAGGANVVAEAAFARCGLVCMPEERPFGEQLARGEDLRANEAAVVLRQGSSPDGWPAVLDAALARRERLARWADGDGAQRAAEWLAELAASTKLAGSSTFSRSSQRISPRSESSSSQPLAGHAPQRR
jgi:hypothetical protein